MINKWFLRFSVYVFVITSFVILLAVISTPVFDAGALALDGNADQVEFIRPTWTPTSTPDPKAPTHTPSPPTHTPTILPPTFTPPPPTHTPTILPPTHTPTPLPPTPTHTPTGMPVTPTPLPTPVVEGTPGSGYTTYLPITLSGR